MSRSTTITLACDRCSTSLVLDDGGDDRAAWGRVAAESGTAERIGGAGGHDDLCPSCLRGLFDWYRGPVVVAPPPAPAASPRGPFTLDDRTRAVGVVADALRVRIGLALECVREAPTEILSGGIVPGALFGLEDSAAGIVDAVLDQLGFTRGGTPR